MNEAMKTRIIIIDDHPFMRAGIYTYLHKEYDLEIVGEAESGEAAIQLVSNLSPHIVIVDLMLTDMPGEKVIKTLKKSHPSTKAIVFSNYSDSTHIKNAYKAGAFGYIIKTDPPELIKKAIRDAMLGQKTFTKLVKEKLTNFEDMDTLGNLDQPLLSER
jgi:two-component system, NarL family, response regulator LiaR